MVFKSYCCKDANALAPSIIGIRHSSRIQLKVFFFVKGTKKKFLTRHLILDYLCRHLLRRVWREKNHYQSLVGGLIMPKYPDWVWKKCQFLTKIPFFFWLNRIFLPFSWCGDIYKKVVDYVLHYVGIFERTLILLLGIE